MSYTFFPSRTPSPLSTTSSTSLPQCHLPRLLFLHGGGVNASIYTAQCRVILPLLRPHFRCIFVDAPFLCDPHPDVISVYGSWGPFRRWLRSQDNHEEMSKEYITECITTAIRDRMEEDERAGGRGEWVGIVGFSQGAKLAASILLEQQIRERTLGGPGRGTGTCGLPRIHWKFGILMAGRAPLVALDPERICSPAFADAHEKTEWSAALSLPPVEEELLLGIPTAHIHGLKDDGLVLHRKMMRDYCKRGTTTLVEWQGTHRIPFKSVDVQAVVEAIFHVAGEARVECSW